MFPETYQWKHLLLISHTELEQERFQIIINLLFAVRSKHCISGKIISLLHHLIFLSVCYLFKWYHFDLIFTFASISDQYELRCMNDEVLKDSWYTTHSFKEVDKKDCKLLYINQFMITFILAKLLHFV